MGLGTDGTYFGLFLESPWPFVMALTRGLMLAFSSSKTCMPAIWMEKTSFPCLLLCSSLPLLSTLGHIGSGKPCSSPSQGQSSSSWGRRLSLVHVGEAITPCRIVARPTHMRTCLFTPGE